MNSVDLIQNFIRRFVFKTLGVSPESEIQRAVPVPSGEAAVVCMDGFDLITRASIESQFHGRVKAPPLRDQWCEAAPVSEETGRLPFAEGFCFPSG